MPELKVVNQNGKLLTDSRDVAEMIERKHFHLVRDIQNYIEVLGKSNFGLADFFIESYYNDTQGKPRPHYLLTKKGCDMVANKMTGQKGVLFTAAYTTKFEEMENQIKQGFKLPSNYKEALLQLVDEVEKNEQLEIQLSLYKPKAEYVDRILQNKGLVTVNQIAKDYGMSARKMNDQLHSLGVQYKQSGQWLLYRKYDNKGYVHSNTVNIVRSDGTPDVKMNTKWTQKGRLFIYELLKEKNILPVIEQGEKHESLG